MTNTGKLGQNITQTMVNIKRRNMLDKSGSGSQVDSSRRVIDWKLDSSIFFSFNHERQCQI